MQQLQQWKYFGKLKQKLSCHKLSKFWHFSIRQDGWGQSVIIIAIFSHFTTYFHVSVISQASAISQPNYPEKPQPQNSVQLRSPSGEYSVSGISVSVSVARSCLWLCLCSSVAPKTFCFRSHDHSLTVFRDLNVHWPWRVLMFASCYIIVWIHVHSQICNVGVQLSANVS